MRVSGQLAVIAVLGAAGFGGWYAYQGGYLANVPVIGAYVAAPATQAPARPAGRRGAAGSCDRRRGHGKDRAHRRSSGIGRHGPCL